jgi:hypothetical protein
VLQGAIEIDERDIAARRGKVRIGAHGQPGFGHTAQLALDSGGFGNGVDFQ